MYLVPINCFAYPTTLEPFPDAGVVFCVSVCVVLLAVLGIEEALEVSCFLLDSKELKIYPCSPFTLTLLHPFSSAITSTAVLIDKLVTTSADLLASFLTLMLVEFTYKVLLTACGCSTTGACTCSGATSSMGCSVFSSCFTSFSFLIHPFVAPASTQAHPFTISITFTSSSFFTSMMSVALITGTMFSLVFSVTFCFPKFRSFSSVSIFCSASLFVASAGVLFVSTFCVTSCSAFGSSAISVFTSFCAVWFVSVVLLFATSPFTVIKSCLTYPVICFAFT